MLSLSSRVAADGASPAGAHLASSKGKGASGRVCKLSFYRDYPTDRVALDDFEQYAIDRLQGECCVMLLGLAHPPIIAAAAAAEQQHKL